MSILSSKFGKAAAGTVIAGVLTLSGMNIANAVEEAPVTNDSTVSVVDPAPSTDTGTTPDTEAGIGDGSAGVGDGGTGWTPPPAPLPGSDAPSVETPVEEPPAEPTPEEPAPAPAPEPAPAPAVNAPGKSGEHRNSTPQQALDNNQSHKQDEKKAEKAAAKAEKKAEKANR